MNNQENNMVYDNVTNNSILIIKDELYLIKDREKTILIMD